MSFAELFRELGQGWRLEARCRGLGSETFIVPGRPQLHRSEREKIAAAKAVCDACPVAVECLDFALDHFEEGGVWGGEYLSTRRGTELRRLRRQCAA